MKKTLCETARAYLEGQELTDGQCRAVLGWFGGASLYFPGKEERRRALDALAWLYENARRLPAEDAPKPDACAARFAQAFDLPPERAEGLVDSYRRRQERREPVIIGIEGLDGSGKTVQAERLRGALEARGMRVRLIDFPQYGSFFGREIGALLAGKEGASALNLDEKSMCLWYALDRWKTVSGAGLEAYDCVIFNRYTLSNVVYQSARKYGGLNRPFADWIFELEHIQLGLPIPDIYLYLQTKAELSGANVLKKEGREYTQGLDVYERSEDLLACCRRIYQELAVEIREIRVLDCLDESGRLKDVEEIGGAVLDCLEASGLLAPLEGKLS